MNVLVFRNDVGALTEGYIVEQGEALERYRAHYVGVRRAEGPQPPLERTFMIGRSTSRFDPRALGFKLTGSLGRLSSRLRALAPQLVHAHFGQDALRILPWARRHRIPLIATFHGSDALMTDHHAQRSHPSHRALARRTPELIAGAARVLAVSSFVRDRLIARGYPHDRCVVHYLGVDVEALAPNANIAREPVVLFVGRLVESKGAADLIDAMREVERRVPTARLVVIGDGPLRGDLESRASRSLRDVRFIGAQSHDRTIGWMQRARVLCVPSTPQPDGSTEAFGLVFAEAHAVGTPVVSCATGGIAEIVRDGETGFLVEPRDVRALAERLVRVLTGDDWSALSQRAREHVCAQFDRRIQTRALEQIYDDVVRAAR